jgi:hypothetical protein
MYEVWQSANNGNLIIQNERDCVEIDTEFVTKFVNELCENEMISEGTKYEELKEQLRVCNALLDERQRLLDAIPECPVHGKCVPYALEWISNQS